MRLFNNGILTLRNKKQEKVGMIYLPDVKICSSKTSTVLAAANQKVSKECVADAEVKPGDVIAKLQYDGIQIKAWDHLTFDLPDSNIKQDRLPEGCEIVFVDNQKDGYIKRLKIKKGVELEIIFGEHVQAVITNDSQVDDQRIA
jgi:co-chaperonin GroES (HSP10)